MAHRKVISRQRPSLPQVCGSGESASADAAGLRRAEASGSAEAGGTVTDR